MTRIRFGRIGIAATLIAAAAPTAGIYAVETPYTTLKELICKTVGCYGTENQCADVKGELKSPTGTGTISVTWYCKEGAKYNGGGASYEFEM